MLTRRGGSFWWVVCNACGEEHLKLNSWGPSTFISARGVAESRVREVCADPRSGWKAGKDGAHVGPVCLAKAEAEARAAKRKIAV